MSLLIAAAAFRRSNRLPYDNQLAEYVDSLEHQVQELRADNIDQNRQLEECKTARIEMQNQNFYLLQEVNELRKKVNDI